MRLSLTVLFPIVIAFACSNNKTNERATYPSKGSMMFFDTTAGNYEISSKDIKLITTWEAFKEAVLNSDDSTLNSLSYDSLICMNCVSPEENPLMSNDKFYENYFNEVFSNSLLSGIVDSSSVRVRYDWSGYFFENYLFLLDNPDIKNPRIAEVLVSFPISPGESEATLALLTFIETKHTYKFLGYSTIP